MDSLTQIVLGASVAAAAVPAGHRRRAIVVGALLGTLPDLDSVPLALMGMDPVQLMTWHRGPSHALAPLALLGAGLWWLLRRAWGPVREQPWRWLLAIQLALLTHPLLDAFTVYGTQLWWPLPVRPVMWSSLFIIDPLYTVPLLVGVLAVLFGGARRTAAGLLVAGLVLSSAYLGWSLAAKAWVERATVAGLAGTGLEDAPRFSVPMPFNTLLWRVVVLTPDGYLEGLHSIVADHGPVRFTTHPSDTGALQAVSGFPSVQRLSWFNHGFMRAREHDGHLVLSDLRMGLEPDYTFNFAVARREEGRWVEIRPEQIRWRREDTRERLAAMWRRIRDPAVEL